MNKFWDIVIPRFVTEATAVLEHKDCYEPICCVEDLKPDDKYDKIIIVQTFNLFGWGLFPKEVVEQEEEKDGT